MDWMRFNVFQRLTRHWDTLHPYNAAQIIRIRGRADPEAIAAQWQSTMSELGLGAVRTNGRSFRWEPLETARPQRDALLMPDRETLNRVMTEQLNEPFDNDAESPFRPLLMQEPDSYCIGVVYHHWVADSYSIRMLLREWFLRIHEPPKARRLALHHPKAGYWRLFGPSQAKWRLDDAVFQMVRWTARFRRARRIDAKKYADFRVHFSLHHAPDGLIDAVAGKARLAGVTVNDVFLAAMAEVCSRFVLEPQNQRRHDIVLGTIVDLRSRAREALDETFGLFLGFTSVFCRRDDMTDFSRLLTRVHQQNRMQKNVAAAESSMMRMAGGLVFAKLFSRDGLLEFYRKRMALAGGISNVNLNRDWPARHYPDRLMEYIRVSPCGPMMPVVFTPTTLGSKLNIGLTCRQSVAPPERAPELAEMFISRLRKFAQKADNENNAIGCVPPPVG